jgi:hypothetical protein
MPKKFDATLKKLDKEHEKVLETLGRELEAAKELISAARVQQQQLEEKLREMEADRPRLASSIFKGSAEVEDLAKIDGEIQTHTRQLEIDKMAEAEAEKRVAELEQSLKEAERAHAERRYDAFALERRERIAGVEAAVEELAGKLSELLSHARGHEQVMFAMGGRPYGRPYFELVEDFLATRLQSYLGNSATRRVAMASQSRIQSLLDVDLYLKTNEEARAHSAAAAKAAKVAQAKSDAAHAAFRRREAFDDRRRALYAELGLPPLDSPEYQVRKKEITPRVESRLMREGYGDLLEAEHLAATGHRKAQVRSTILGGRDYDSLEEPEREQVETAVSEWLADEAATVQAVKVN